MDLADTPTDLAEEATAPLVEWEEDLLVFTPANANTLTVHLASVSLGICP
jgi:hypothetical protein